MKPIAGKDGLKADFTSRAEAIEESYELMLAYAARGLSAGHGSESSRQIRERLQGFDGALTGLAEVVSNLVDQLKLQPAPEYRRFVDLLGLDVDAAQVALRLVLAQPSITSQLVDNLNASLHVRTLLTDLFLIDEVLKGHPAPSVRSTDE